jgi:hypothetical protein
MSTSNSFPGSMKLRLWLRRLSVSSPRMTIRSNLPWPVRILAYAAVLGLAAAVAMWTYEMGRRFTGLGASKEQIESLQEKLEKVQAERDRFSSTVNAAESQMNMERAAQKQLASQVRSLEAENVKLKEDLAFFESLLPANTGPLGVSIRRLKAEATAPGQLRYRLLIMQGGKSDREFSGDLQLAVTFVQGGKSAMMLFPDTSPNDAPKFKLSFKHYQRVEGVLTLPEGAAMKTLQARILDKGQIKTQQTINL